MPMHQDFFQQRGDFITSGRSDGFLTTVERLFKHQVHELMVSGNTKICAHCIDRNSPPVCIPHLPGSPRVCICTINNRNEEIG